MNETRSRDLTCGRAGLLIWVLPAVLLGIAAGFGGWVAALSWPPLLVFMGAACLENARRCGRMHCYFTGPFFLLLAVLSLLYGVGVLGLGPHGWQQLMTAFLIGTCVLLYVPEWLFGKYRRRQPPSPGTVQ